MRGLGDHAEEKLAHSRERVVDLLSRLAWLLNDESGATGWGAPEAIGEILARAPDLKPSFAPRLLSWLDNEEVFLDQEVLDAGTLWSMGRIGPADAFAESRVAPVVARFLEGGSALTRGAAAFCAGRLGYASLAPILESLTGDDENLTLLIDGEIVERSVGDLAREALAALG